MRNQEYEEKRLKLVQQKFAEAKRRHEEQQIEKIKQEELLRKKDEANRIAKEEEKKRIENEEEMDTAKTILIAAGIISVLLMILLMADLDFIGQGITFVISIVLMFYSVRSFPASSSFLLLILFPLFTLTVVVSLLQAWVVIWILIILGLAVWSFLIFRKYQ